MKFYQLIFLFTTIALSILTSFGNSLNIKRDLKSNLKYLASLRAKTGAFDPMKVTKYYKNQKPPSNLNTQFTDDLFPPNQNSIDGKDANGNKTDAASKDENLAKMQATEWKRAKDIWPGKQIYVFKDAIQAEDVVQRSIGHCYFISAIAAVTEFPHLIYQLFRTLKYNPNGYYELVFFIDGEWQILILDDYFLVKKNTTPITLFGIKPNNEELWVMLLEKAWAKLNGGYTNIWGGLDTDSFLALTGYTSNLTKHSQSTSDDIWNIISSADTNNYIIAASSLPAASGVAEDPLTNGVISSHAYTVVGSVMFSYTDPKDKTLKTVKLIKLRNPHGKNEFTGDWSDNSPLWTDETKKLAGYTKSENEGIFFIPLQDFFTSYSNTITCHVPYGWVYKSYNVNGENFTAPSVYNLILEEDSDIILDIFSQHPRFHKAAGENPSVMTSAILATYDTNRVLNIVDAVSDKKHTATFDKTKLAKGNYVLWIYNSYFKLKTPPQPDHYIVRLMSQSSKVNFAPRPSDKDGKLIRKLMLYASTTDLTPTVSTKYNLSRTSTFRNTNIGVYKIQNTSTKPLSTSFDLSKNTDSTNVTYYDFLPPYQTSQGKTINTDIAPQKTVIYVGILVKLDASSLSFSVGTTFPTTATSDKITLEYAEDLDISSYVSLPSALPPFVYDFITPTIDEALNGTFRRNRVASQENKSQKVLSNK